jgi:uncharacterized protein YraI
MLTIAAGEGTRGRRSGAGANHRFREPLTSEAGRRERQHSANEVGTMRTKLLALAAGAALIAGTGAASAAMVTGDLHLRAGPGTNYPVIDTMPAGSHVNVRNCTGGWCRLSYRGESGWASDNFLSGRSRTTTVYRSRRIYREPYAETYVAPGYAYGPDYYDYGPYAYEPGFSIGFGFGGGWGGGHHHWGGGRHWSGGGHHWSGGHFAGTPGGGGHHWHH